MNRDHALKIFNQVRETYDQIAKSFSQTRSKVWPEFLFVKDLVKEGGRVLDFGCGNGRFYQVFEEKADYFGVDISKNLIVEAEKKFPEGKFYHFDGFHIPFEDNFFDLVIAIAVFHHIPSKELREEILSEIKRVLKSNGLLVVSVWYLLDKPKILANLLANLVRNFPFRKLELFDIFIPWQKRYLRYVHLFRKGALKKELEESGFLVEKIFFLEREREKNLVALVRK